MAQDILQNLADHIEVVRDLEPVVPDIEAVADRLVTRIEGGGTIFWMGNGGSAADSQHLAAELVGRFRRERTAVASLALTTDTSALTAIGNDYGFDSVFERQVAAQCNPGDVVVGISTSGNSTNVLRAVGAATDIGADTIGLTGDDGGALADRVDLCVSVPSDETARIQEAHILIGHILCERVEQAVVNDSRS